MKYVPGLITIFISAPIWYYLLYTILTAINAGELTWFLYWVYVPFAVFAQIVSKVVEANGKSEPRRA